MTRAFLGLGSNLGDRRRLLRDAVRSLPDVVAVSGVYETDPVGGPEQGAYLNLVVQLETQRSARELLEVAREREAAADRVRAQRWGPRTLDVDVLWVDGIVVDELDLVVPHPRMHERAFVMVPLAELAPDLVADWADPGVGAVRRVGPLFATHRARVVGGGRAGRSFAAALSRRGWEVAVVSGRDRDVAGAATGVELVLVTVPDGHIAAVAQRIVPDDDAVVAHVAGSLGVDVLDPHPHRAALHPLVSLPDAETGARRLMQGPWVALSADPGARPLAHDLLDTLGARPFAVAEQHRALYHAAACVAANHLVALLAQVERLAASIDVPFEAYLELARTTLENVAAVGPARALTGPAARGDHATIERHLAVLPADERPAYEALVAEARRVAEWRS